MLIGESICKYSAKLKLSWRKGKFVEDVKLRRCGMFQETQQQAKGRESNVVCF